MPGWKWNPWAAVPGALGAASGCVTLRLLFQVGGCCPGSWNPWTSVPGAWVRLGWLRNPRAARMVGNRPPINFHGGGQCTHKTVISQHFKKKVTCIKL